MSRSLSFLNCLFRQAVNRNIHALSRNYSSFASLGGGFSRGAAL